MIPKTTHLAINGVNTLTACGVYCESKDKFTYDTRKVNCKKCNDKIELIWTFSIWQHRLSGIIEDLKKLLKDTD